MVDNKKKGQITMIFVFMVTAIIIIVISAVMAPMMVEFNTEMYKAGEDILNTTQKDLLGINDDTIRNQINASIVEAQAATVNNIDVGTDLYQYGWVFIVVIVAIVIFLFTRQTVEFTGGGFI